MQVILTKPPQAFKGVPAHQLDVLTRIRMPLCLCPVCPTVRQASWPSPIGSDNHFPCIVQKVALVHVGHISKNALYRKITGAACGWGAGI